MTTDKPAIAPRLIACRLAAYGPFRDAAWEHLPSIGIRHVEMAVPDDVAQARRRLADHGLSASSLQGRCDITADDAVERMKPQLEACRALDAGYCFLSVKAGDADRPAVYRRLHQLGEAAAGADVTIVLETHPDLVHNAQTARTTLQAVDHPGIRVNFDTANIYFYNHDLTAVGELDKIIDHVAAVHLKDTTGEHRTPDFPALGQGVVDFPRVFEMLDKDGFTGPCTMELEGKNLKSYDRDQRLAHVADSADYLRRIGALRSSDG